MNRRFVVLAGVVLLILGLGVSYSTARAGQLQSEQRAHSSAVLAESNVEGALRHAAAVGLRPNEIHPYLSTLTRIKDTRPPASSPFWSSGIDSYYARQTRAYRALVRNIGVGVQRATAKTRSRAGKRLRNLRAVILHAQALDVPVTAANAALTRLTASYRTSATPGAYRHVAHQVNAPENRLKGSMRSQQEYVSHLLATTHNSRTAIINAANAEAQGALATLPLLSLLTPRASVYQSELNGQLQTTNAQPTAFAAAVKESHLHAESDLVIADYKKTVPSKLILISTKQQTASLYQDGQQIFSTPVTTGGPELPTDHGVFHIYEKISPFTFHSPWPPGSPYYYLPSYVQYWMPFYLGEGLHDASWRSNFGPGSNLQPTDLGTGYSILGTHGCVNLPLDAAKYIWNWAPLGTTVVVV